MNMCLVHVGGDSYCQVLPRKLDGSKADNGRGKVMGQRPHHRCRDLSRTQDRKRSTEALRLGESPQTETRP